MNISLPSLSPISTESSSPTRNGGYVCGPGPADNKPVTEAEVGDREAGVAGAGVAEPLAESGA